jgi:hypothetical protein
MDAVLLHIASIYYIQKTACQKTSVREFCRLNIGNFKQYFAAIEQLSFCEV